MRRGSPFGFAALRHGAEEVIATDKNLNVLEAGAEVCGRFGHTMSVRRWDCLKERFRSKDRSISLSLHMAYKSFFPAAIPTHLNIENYLWRTPQKVNS